MNVSSRPPLLNRRSSARRVVAVSTVSALAGLGDALLYVVLPLSAPALGLSGFQVGLLLSANRFVRMVTNSSASWLMRRFPPGPPFTAAAGMAAVSTALYALTPAFLPFMLARLVWGLVFSTLRLGCFFTVLAVATDGTRGRLMGVYRSIARCGAFVAVIAGGALSDAYGYRAAMLAMAAVSALALPLALWQGPDLTPRPPSLAGKGETRSAAVDPSSPFPAREGGRGVRSRLLAVNWSAFALAFVARGVVVATLALFLLRAFGDRFGPGGAIGVATLGSWLIGVRWIAEIGLAAPLGALSDHVGRARSAVVWLLVAAGGVLGLALAPAVGVAAAAAIVVFVASSGLGATLDAAAGDLAPADRRAQVMSAYADWSDLGAAFGPLLALTFAGSLGLRPSYALGALLLVSGAAAMLIAGRAARARQAAPA